MTIKFTDNALSHLAVNISTTDTIISVSPGDGSLYPAVVGTGADYFVITLEDANGNREFVRVDHVDGDTFGSATYPCTRGYWGSTARAFSSGDVVDLRWTAGAITDLFGSYVEKSGDTMTGALTLSGDPTNNLHAATKQYVDAQRDTRVAKAGDTMTGLLTLSADPTSALHAATKQYADTKVAKAGDTMTGLLTLSGDPTDALHAATKQYVDSATFKDVQGQCILEYTNSTTITLKPYNGNKLRLYYNGAWDHYTIPSAGVTLAPPSTAGFYYIWAYWTGSAIALEASSTSSTSRVEDSNTGYQVKSGDTTRLLVGLAHSGGSSWTQNDNRVRGVRTWYNRRPFVVRGGRNNTKSTSSTTSVNLLISSEYCYAVLWSDEVALLQAKGSAYNSNIYYLYLAAGYYTGSGWAFGPSAYQWAHGSTAYNSMAAPSVYASPAGTAEQAWTYGTVGGAVSGGTGTFANMSVEMFVSMNNGV